MCDYRSPGGIIVLLIEIRPEVSKFKAGLLATTQDFQIILLLNINICV
jgi:hypothetical protein